MNVGCVVIDAGGLYTRMGIAGDDMPNSVFRTVVNCETNEVGTESNTGKDEKPITDGTITDFETMKRIWDHGMSLVEASDKHTSFETIIFCRKPHTTIDEQTATV